MEHFIYFYFLETRCIRSVGQNVKPESQVWSVVLYGQIGATYVIWQESVCALNTPPPDLWPNDNEISLFFLSLQIFKY